VHSICETGLEELRSRRAAGVASDFCFARKAEARLAHAEGAENPSSMATVGRLEIERGCPSRHEAGRQLDNLRAAELP
jgi:hypothetical protein